MATGKFLPERGGSDVDLLFPFAEYWWFYASVTLLVLLNILLALDLGVFHRTAQVITFPESLTWSIVWVTLALAFNYGFYLTPPRCTAPRPVPGWGSSS